MAPSLSLHEILRRSRETGDPDVFRSLVRPPAYSDVARIPVDAEYIELLRPVANVRRLEHLSLRALGAPATDELLELLPKLQSLEALSLYADKKTDVTRVARAARLRHLKIRSASLTSLDFLTRMPSLLTLSLWAMPKAKLESLPHLPGLIGLRIHTGMGRTVKVPSLEPIANAPNLRFLALWNLVPQDGSLAPLARLGRLRHLELASVYSIEQFAEAAVQFEGIEFNCGGPIFELPSGEEITVLKCAKCGGRKLIMTGSPTAIVCPRCDEKRYRRRVEQWNAAVADARRRRLQ